MKNLYRYLVTAALLATSATPVLAGSRHDGAWDLIFVTQRGPCDPTYNFRVDISNGIVSHPNLVRFSGKVAANGNVRASVTVQDKHARGSGRLTGNSGRGIWIGHARGERCSGYWSGSRN